MNWWSEFKDRMTPDAPIAGYTWYRLGGPADYLFQPRSVEELSALVQRAKGESVPVRVLGGGANVLIRDDGVEGVVVRLDDDAFRSVKYEGTRIDVGAGVDLMPLSSDCSQRGLSGLECMAGIPGTVGGAVRMNAGGKFGEIGDVVEEVTVLDTNGNIDVRDHDRIGFTYRNTELSDVIVLSVRLRLREEDPVDCQRLFDKCFEFKQRSQPMAAKSAGCVFKNPPGESAGALIDQSGLKGTRVGKVHVSKQHANFLVADPGATASDVLSLIDLVRKRVCDEFGIELEVEIDVW